MTDTKIIATLTECRFRADDEKVILPSHGVYRVATDVADSLIAQRGAREANAAEIEAFEDTEHAREARGRAAAKKPATGRKKPATTGRKKPAAPKPDAKPEAEPEPEGGEDGGGVL